MAKRYETRAVLAGAYRSKAASMLSHAVELDDNGEDLRVLCDRVDLWNLADHFAQNVHLPPTCPRCAAALRKETE